ncbi:hypothetical protein C8Q75DRAFT_287678 [Abortiporus biennis]|nr:hypothetical protein C8Q75DRAFT_287678 [Abortiporus biennis]
MRFSASVLLAVLLAASSRDALAAPLAPEGSLVTRDASSLTKRFGASLPHSDRYRYNGHMVAVIRDESSANLAKRDIEDLTLRELNELQDRGFISDVKNTWNSAKDTFRAGRQAYNNFRTKWHAKRELVERDVVLDSILKRDFEELTLRDLDELEARGFVSDVKNTWDHARATYHAGRQAYDSFRTKWHAKRNGLIERDDILEDIMKRDFEELTMRDLEELEARGFISDVKNTWNQAKATYQSGRQAYNNFRSKWHAKRDKIVERDTILEDLLKRDYEELTMRDLAELESRGFLGDVKNTWSHAKETFNAGRQAYNSFKSKWHAKRDDLVERDVVLEDIMKREFEELTMRDLIELEARGFISDVKNTWSHAKDTFNAGRQAYNSFRSKWHAKRDDLVERDAVLEDIMRRDFEELTMRDFKELEARGFISDVKNTWNHAKATYQSGRQAYNNFRSKWHAKRDDLIERDTDVEKRDQRLEARKYQFYPTGRISTISKVPVQSHRYVFHTVSKVPVPSHIKRELIERDAVLEDILKRDYEELTMRDLEELEARGFLSDIKNTWHEAKETYHAGKQVWGDVKDKFAHHKRQFAVDPVMITAPEPVQSVQIKKTSRPKTKKVQVQRKH